MHLQKVYLWKQVENLSFLFSREINAAITENEADKLVNMKFTKWKLIVCAVTMCANYNLAPLYKSGP